MIQIETLDHGCLIWYKEIGVTQKVKRIRRVAPTPFMHPPTGVTGELRGRTGSRRGRNTKAHLQTVADQDTRHHQGHLRQFGSTAHSVKQMITVTMTARSMITGMRTGNMFKGNGGAVTALDQVTGGAIALRKVAAIYHVIE